MDGCPRKKLLGLWQESDGVKGPEENDEQEKPKGMGHHEAVEGFEFGADNFTEKVVKNKLDALRKKEKGLSEEHIRPLLQRELTSAGTAGPDGMDLKILGWPFYGKRWRT